METASLRRRLLSNLLTIALLPSLAFADPSNTFTANAISNGSAVTPVWHAGQNVTITWTTWYSKPQLVYLPPSQDSYTVIYTLPSSTTSSFNWTVNVTSAAGWGTSDPTIYLGIFDESGERFISSPVEVLPTSSPLADSTPLAAASTSDGVMTTGAIIGLSLGGALLALLAVFAALFLCRQRIDRWAANRRAKELAHHRTFSTDDTTHLVSTAPDASLGAVVYDRKTRRAGDAGGDYTAAAPQPPVYGDDGAAADPAEPNFAGFKAWGKGGRRVPVDLRVNKALPSDPPLSPNSDYKNGAMVQVKSKATGPVVEGMEARVTGPLDEVDFGADNWGRDLPWIVSSRAGQQRKQTRRGRAELRTVERPQELDDTELVDVMIMPGSPRSVFGFGRAVAASGQPVLAWARSLRRPPAVDQGYERRREHVREMLGKVPEDEV